MIVVFVTHTHPPLVFETTPSLLVAHAMDHAAASGTLPQAGAGLNFESAWQNLTRDLKAAFHFPDADTARKHFENDDTLGLHPRTQIISALSRLSSALSASTPQVPASAEPSGH